MRAVLVERHGDTHDLTPADIDDPEPQSGEVVVAVEVAGVNPVDIGNARDGTWAGLTPPYVVGYEFSGRVLTVPEASDLRTGDPVWGLQPVRGTRWGAYAERVAVPAGLVARRPDVLDAVSAGALPLAGITAMQILDRMSLSDGASLLVHGASGGVGHLLLQLARSRGIRVVAAARRAARDRVLECGAAEWVDRESPDVAAVAARTMGGQLDAVVDLVGDLLAPALPHVAVGGHAASITALSGDFEEAVDRNIDLHGVLVRPGADALWRLADGVADGLRPAVTATYPLADVAEAHRRLEAGGVGGKLALIVA